MIRTELVKKITKGIENETLDLYDILTHLVAEISISKCKKIYDEI